MKAWGGYARSIFSHQIGMWKTEASGKMFGNAFTVS